MRRFRIVVVAGVAAACAIVLGIRAWRGPAVLTIDTLDVGQGDAILVHVGRLQALIDGGPDRKVLSSLGEVMPLADRRLEFVILSHPDNDHIAGLFPIVRRYDVGTLVLAEAWREHSAAVRLAAEAREKGIPIVEVATGDLMRLGDDILLEVLWPDASATLEVNDLSIVMTVDGLGDGIEAILTGDIEIAAETLLTERGMPRARLLKAGHHGSRTSSATAFVEAIMPEHAVISVGAENRFGHPSAAVLMRLTALGTAVWRTDTLGTVRFIFAADGLRVRARSWRGWAEPRGRP